MESSAQLQPLPVPVAGEVRILDDDEQVLRCLSLMVRSFNLGVRSYQDAEEFLADESETTPSCLVVDWQLNGMDGLDVVARCQDQWPQVPVILISGQATISLAVSAMRQGVVGVLEKPVRPAELKKEIATAIELGRQRTEAGQRCADAQAKLERLNDWELTILKLLVEGTPNKNIATQMNLAMRTIEKYRRSLFDKLGVESAAEASRVWTLANLQE
ncbi:MAG: response regulator [Pirellulaceae bacterium]